MIFNYKDTLNLPKTKFSMKANLITSELKTLKKWYKDDLYSIVRFAKRNKKIFLLCDGPPYANGNIHIGHAVNKILKDIILKFKGLMGYNVFYVPGWDCHGLPIELKVEKKNDQRISNNIDFIKKCRKYVNREINNQKKDFIRLGILADWKNSYLTMNFSVESNIIRLFSKFLYNGFIYREIKPIYWCVKCMSSVSDSEIEYKNFVSLSIYFSFSAVSNEKISNLFNVKFIYPISIVVWTTTPWTIPLNKAISVHPDLIYVLIKVKNRGFIVAKKMIFSFIKKMNFLNWNYVGFIKGYFLELCCFNHPFMNFYVPIVLSKNVIGDTGTGIVHISPSSGLEDYIVAKKYNLKIKNQITKDGYYYNVSSSFNKLYIFKCNYKIINFLKKNNSLLLIENFQHNYPKCYRHNIPIIFRKTMQWFFNLDKNNFRKKLINIIDHIQYIPNFCKKYFKSMILNRPNWCISRQRIWGVPIPVFLHKKTNKLHPNTFKLIKKIVCLVKKKGIEYWWNLNIKDFLGYDGKNYKKSTDVLDVWFDSGSVFKTVNILYNSFIKKKIDLYLEGFDQYRGWFMASLIISFALNKKSPVLKILSHGFVVDQNKIKMSKSFGNIINPIDIVNKFGGDILRLWVSSLDYTSDMLISNKNIKNSCEIYRKIRNTVRFFLSNLDDFDPKFDIVDIKNMVRIDRWAINRARYVQKKIIIAYNNFYFYKVIQYVVKFCSLDMGSLYLDIVKDRKYTSKKESLQFKSVQTAFYYIVLILVRWISPILSFTADEIWKNIPGDHSQYVFTEEWYDLTFFIKDSYMNSSFWKIIFLVREEVNKVIDFFRFKKVITHSLEANIILYVVPFLFSILKKLDFELRYFFIVSSIIIDVFDNASYNSFIGKKVLGLKIDLFKSREKKCNRCWHYTKIVNNKYVGICSRCIKNIFGLGENRKFI